MNTEEKKTAVLKQDTPEIVKKTYKTPVIREYGSINDLVQSSPGAGNDGLPGDDGSASI